MKALTLLTALALAAAALAILPEAAAAPAKPCVVGDDAAECVVTAEFYVCVTEPCEVGSLCVAYGAYCQRI
jgi:hypothetical protein